MVPLIRRAAAVAAVALALGARTSGAQGSPFVPLGDPAYAYLTALQARGGLRSLSLLERPYRADRIRAALEADSARGGRAERSWRDRLAAALVRFEPPDSGAGPWLRATASASVTAQTSAQRDLLAADETAGVLPAFAPRASAVLGPISIGLRGGIDQRLRRDPDFPGSRTRSISGRLDDAYLDARWRFAELLFGRLGRNWGPPTLPGLAVGESVYSYDQLFGRVGVEALHLSTIAARLDEYTPTPDTAIARYFAAHRLQARAGDVEVAVGEQAVYGGAGRGFEPSFVNPLGIYTLAQYDEGRGANLSYTLDAAWRAGERGVYSFEGYLDDAQVDKCDTSCREPSSYGLTVTAEGVPVFGAQRAFAAYTRVSNLAYRTPQPFERYADFGVGLGRAFSDYDELRAGLDLAIPEAPPVRAYVAVRRQGEGDYRLPFPARADYATTPGIFAGVVERTVRVGASAAGRMGPISLDVDAGVNRVSNDAHRPGVHATRAAARLRVSIEPDALLRLRCRACAASAPGASFAPSGP